MSRRSIATWCLPVVVACHGETLDLGAGNMTPCPHAGPEASSPVDGGGGNDGGPNLGPLLGTWQGYAENTHFPSGSGTIAIAFTKQSDVAITGAVTYGQGTPPPPPTDPNVGYSPANTTDGGQYTTLLIEGFRYTALDVKFDGTRLQLQTSEGEAWKSWCELQTPTSDGWGCGHYGCLPNGPGTANYQTNVCTVQDPVTGQSVTFDCRKAAFCDSHFGTCSCSANGCTVDLSAGDTSFDMQLSGSKLEGSAVGLAVNAGSPVNVHFAKM